MVDSSDRSRGTGPRSLPRGRHAASERARALATQRLVEGEGRVVVEGPPGAGKTSLLRSLQRRAPPDVEPRFVPFVNVAPEELEAWLAGLDAVASPRASSTSRTVWLLVDEAQGMPPETAARLAALAGDSPVPLRLVLAGTTGRALEAVVRALGGPAARIRIEAGFDADEVEALVRAWAEARELPRERLPEAAALLRATDGWPGPLALDLEQRLFALEEEAAHPGAQRTRRELPTEAPPAVDPAPSDPSRGQLARLAGSRREPRASAPGGRDESRAHKGATRGAGFAPAGPHRETAPSAGVPRDAPDPPAPTRDEASPSGGPSWQEDGPAARAPKEDAASETSGAGLATGLLGVHSHEEHPASSEARSTAFAPAAGRSSDPPDPQPGSVAPPEPPDRRVAAGASPEGAAPHAGAGAPASEPPRGRAGERPSRTPPRATRPSGASPSGGGRRAALALGALGLVALIGLGLFASREGTSPGVEGAPTEAPAPPSQETASSGAPLPEPPPSEAETPALPESASTGGQPPTSPDGSTGGQAASPESASSEGPLARQPEVAGPPSSDASLAEDVEPGAEEVAVARVEPEGAAVAAPEPVRVNINVRPWARVFVDGREIGTTPLAEVPLAPGGHDLRAVLPDGEEILTRVDVDEETRFISLPRVERHQQGGSR